MNGPPSAASEAEAPGRSSLPDRRSVRRRLVRVTLILGGVLLALSGTAYWALGDVDLPDPGDLLPARGDALVIQVPRGLLDSETQRLLIASLSYLDSQLAHTAFWRSAEEWRGVRRYLARTRPWQFILWTADLRGSSLDSGHSEDAFAILSGGGLGRVITAISGGEQPRPLRAFGRTLWAARRGESIVLATHEARLRHVLERLGTAAPAPRMRHAIRLIAKWTSPDSVTGVNGHEEGGATRLSARLLPLDGDRWRLEARAAGAPRGLETEAIRDLRRACESENLEARDLRTTTSEDDAGSWTVLGVLVGIRRAMLENAERLEFWTDLNDPSP